MRSSKTALFALAALLVLCFTLAARLSLWFGSWPGNRSASPDLVATVFGDSRRLLAEHFFVKADAYFHSGFYPSVFDRREAFQTPHIAEDSGTVAGHNEGDEHDFMGQPRDWIERFGRNFFPSTHTHLDQSRAGEQEVELGGSSDVREILPWLQLSAKLDPNDVRSFTVTAYWLRDRLGKVDEAERFLREGLRANPGSSEILFELGRVFVENRGDPDRARNLWEAGLRNWREQESAGTEPDPFLFLQLTSRLALLAQKQGHAERALHYMEFWKSRSPNPGKVQEQIDDLKQSLAAKQQDQK